MAVGGKNVLPAVQIVVEEEGAERQEVEARRSQSYRMRTVGEKCLPIILEQRERFPGEVADHQSETPVLRPVRGIDPHSRLGLGVLAERDPRFDAPLDKSLALL